MNSTLNAVSANCERVNVVFVLLMQLKQHNGSAVCHNLKMNLGTVIAFASTTVLLLEKGQSILASPEAILGLQWHVELNALNIQLQQTCLSKNGP